MTENLTELHLADLHARAAELGVNRFRSLRREQLIAEIEARGGGGGSGRAGASPVEAAPSESEDEASSAETPPQGIAAVEAKPDREREPLEPAEAEPVTGVLEITPQRFGFLRIQGIESSSDDVYVSASQVRRCELRPGDQVSGPARPPRRGERHRALVQVEKVNGLELDADRPAFDTPTPVLTRRRLTIDADRGDVLTRAVDLLVPLALGQRVLVSAQPRS